MIAAMTRDDPDGAAAAEAEPDFEALVAPEVGRLFGIAVTILRDRAEAEDAVQETLTRAWTRQSTLRDAVARRAWLTRICVNYCISRRRRLLRLPQPFADPPRPPIGTWDLDARGLDLDRAYAALSARQRAALLLFYHHGHSVEECGELMSCAPGTVRSHLARALTALRKEMRDA
jgi:RNA polymerase sigma-70 factor (ECF subfamily)